MRLLILCTHNSARSQIGEGWLRFWADKHGFQAEIFSAGTEATFVKPDAIAAMAEVGIDLSSHSSKTLFELPEATNFDVVITVCDSANEACPVYPAKTQRLHVSFLDPSGKPLEAWRKVRDAIGRMCEYLIIELKNGRFPSEESLRAASGLETPNPI